MTEHIQPHDLDAEQSLLGAMLQSPETVIPVVQELVDANDFYRDTHRRLYAHMLKMWVDDESSVDVVALANVYPDDHDLIWTLEEFCPSAANCKNYATMVHRDAASRSLVRVGNEIAAMGYGGSDLETGKLIDAAEHKLMGLRPQSARDVHGAGDLGRSVLASIESGERPSMVSTGFRSIDQYSQGLHAGALTIVGARPGVGKTCLGLSLAHRVSKENAVLFFSMEMRSEELMERLLANVGCTSLTHIRERNLTPDELANLYRAQAEIEQLNLQFIDNTSLTLLSLKSKVRKYVKSHDVKLVVVDYLQLMRMGTRCENRREEVSEMSRELKGLAMECNIHIMALSQLNRVSTFDGTKVDISQLKESGSLEQDADQVWLLSWPKEENGARFVTVDIAKNRNGPLGAVDLVWMPAWQRYEE